MACSRGGHRYSIRNMTLHGQSRICNHFFGRNLAEAIFCGWGSDFPKKRIDFLLGDNFLPHNLAIKISASDLPT